MGELSSPFISEKLIGAVVDNDPWTIATPT